MTEMATQPDRTRKQLSASLLMTSGTAVSRVLGFVRAMLIAFVLGNGTRQVEMFTLGNTVPNMIYVLLAGGILNTVFVPQIVRAIKKHDDGGEAYTNRLLTVTLVALAVITVAATLAAPLIVEVYVSNAWDAAELVMHHDNIVMLAYLCLPQLFFYGAHVLIGQVLNARERFGPMMWAPIANNLISIAVFGLYLMVWGADGATDTAAPFSTGQMWLLGGGATLGIVAQAAVLVPYLKASGHTFRPRFDWRGVGLGHTARLARWTVLFVAITQVGLAVVTRVASSAPAGGSGAGFNVYNQAYLLWIMPHSLITVSLVTAMLTSASERAAHNDLAGVATESMRTMKLALVVLLPTSVAFLALGLPVTRIIFGWGEGAADAEYLGWTLMALALGLVPFTLNYVCQRTFYAMEDTRSTFFQQFIVVAINVAIALLLVLPFGKPELVAPALGLSYALAYLIGFGITFRWLRGRLPALNGGELLRLGVRCLLAVLPGAILAAVVCTWLARDVGQLARIGLLAISAAVAVAMYFGLARVLHITEVQDLIATVRRRRSPSSPDPDSANPDSAVTARTTGESTSALSNISDEAVLAGAGAGEETVNGERGDTQQAPRRSDPPTADDSPTELIDPLEASPPTRAMADVASGTVLGERYRLEVRMEEHGGVTTWRAFDSVLSRSVVIHLLPPGDERAGEVLASARRAATATDSRFLRVLDAVQSLDETRGSYVVCEYSPGQNLTDLLAHGPLSALEAAWVVREVADAMTGVHSAGLYHLRISPNTVWITPTGNVKIGDMAIRAELRPSSELDPGDPATLKRGRTAFHPETDEAHDVADLGRLLYACLVHRWPGGYRYGLEAAPTNGADGWLTPRQVRHGVSPALDRICDAILSSDPRHGRPLRTATEVVNALTRVLGAADASGDLERRLQHPVPAVPPETGEPEIQTQTPLAVYREQASSEQAYAGSPASPSGGGVAGGYAANRTYPEEQSPPATRRWMFGAIVLLLAILLVAVIAVVTQLRGAEDDPGTNPSLGSQTSPGQTGPPAPVQLEIVGGTDFDPQGGDQTENADAVPNAFDGDPETAWTTDRYRGSAAFGGIPKDGVGIIIDLGSVKRVTRVELLLSHPGADLELRVPVGEVDGDDPPKGSLNDWQALAVREQAEAELSLELSEPPSTRYLLIVFTHLAPEGDQFQAGVSEVEVYG